MAGTESARVNYKLDLELIWSLEVGQGRGLMFTEGINIPQAVDSSTLKCQADSSNEDWSRMSSYVRAKGTAPVNAGHGKAAAYCYI